MALKRIHLRHHELCLLRVSGFKLLDTERSLLYHLELVNSSKHLVNRFVGSDGTFHHVIDLDLSLVVLMIKLLKRHIGNRLGSSRNNFSKSDFRNSSESEHFELLLVVVNIL